MKLAGAFPCKTQIEVLCPGTYKQPPGSRSMTRPARVVFTCRFIPHRGETPSQWREVAFQRGSSIPGTPSSRKGAAAYHRSGKPPSAPAAGLKQPAHEPGMHPRPAHPPPPPEFTLTSSDQKNVQELGNPGSTTPARPRVHPGNPFPFSKSTLNQNVDIIFIINND